MPTIETLEDRTLLSFLLAMTFNTGTEPSAVLVGDFRGTGKLDLAVTNLAGSSVSVLLGNGDGSFQGAVNYPVSSNPRSLATDHFLVSAAVDTVVAGTPFDFTVTVQDAYNNTVTGYTGTVSFSSGDPAGATLPDNYTFTTGTGGDNGVHTFAGGATLYTVGTWDVTATDSSDPTITGSAFVTVTPAAAVSFTIAVPASVP